MFAQSASFGRMVLMGAAVAALAFGSNAVAGPISVGSLTGGPPLLNSLEPGMPINSENLVTTQFRNAGLDNTVFQNLAVSAMASVNGVTAFVPAVNNGNGAYNLDFGGFVGFQVVKPTPGSTASPTTNYVSVEFIGDHPGDGFLYAMTPTGGILGGTMADDGIGPNGGRLATLTFEGIGMFAAWSMFDQGSSSRLDALQNTWGIAAIAIDSAFPPIGGGTNTPEPATLSLAGLGIAGALSAAWKRRRTIRLA